MRIVRTGALALSACAVLALAASMAAGWLRTAERNALLIEAARSVRAGLVCARAHGAELPQALAAGALPGICNLLAGEDALALVGTGRDIGYRRIAPDRYRICAGLADPAAAALARLRPAGAGVHCVEETLPEPATHPRRKRSLA